MDRGIVKIAKEKIIMNFDVDGENYIAVEDNQDFEGNAEILFFKLNNFDENFDCAMSVDDEQILSKVKKRFEQLVLEMEGE